MKSKKPLALIILDGWGYRSDSLNNPIQNTQLPTYYNLLNSYPHTYLHASGEFVGLPKGMMGNSAVGHLTIGAGKRIKQPITRLLDLCESHELGNNQAIVEIVKQIKMNNSVFHVMGLLTDAGVHGHIRVFIELLHIAKQHMVPCILHPILDGRDTPARYAHNLLQQLEDVCSQINWGTIGSIHGRWYAMDRDMAWERITQSINVLCGKTKNIQSWKEALAAAYKKQLTDEFVPPTLVSSKGIIHDHDGVIITNTRADRARELTAALTNFNGILRTVDSHSTMPDFKIPSLEVVTAIEYHPQFNTPVILEPIIVQNTLGDMIEDAGLTQFTIAETEKYAHVTYFLNGGKEIIRNNETRVMVPSKKVDSFDMVPEMSANEITEHVINHLKKDPADFYVINYANADMVGHTGNIEALQKALICIDHQLKELYNAFVVKKNGIVIITADHGNAEDKRVIEGFVSRAHTTNKVPLIVVQTKNQQELECTELADIKNLIATLLI